MAKHRKPTNRSKKLAALGAAFAIPGTLVATSGEALAGPPGGWGPITSCESGGDPTAQNAHSTASGAFQFINGTWAAYGGLEFAPTAKQATYAEQLIVAERAYAAEGTSPWNASKSCWAGKVGQEEVDDVPYEAHSEPEDEVLTSPVEQLQILPVVTPKGQYTPGGSGSYEVKAGDTLTFIARDYGTSVDELMDHNGDIIEDRDWIYVGEKLNIPASHQIISPQPE